MTLRNSILALFLFCLFIALPVDANQCRFGAEFASSDDLNFAPTVLGTGQFGSGSSLLLGGHFSRAGGKFTRGPLLTNGNFATWNGQEWGQMPSEEMDHPTAAVWFDDGAGPELYVATAGSNVVQGSVLRLRGGAWERIDQNMGQGVETLLVFDDGSGPALYAGGRFRRNVGAPADYVARFRNGAWSALAGNAEPNNWVTTLAAHNDGNGNALYLGGRFDRIGSTQVNYVAVHRNGAFQGVGSGLNLFVTRLLSHNDGSGPALYAGGAFTSSGGQQARRIARWNGSTWSEVGGGMDSEVATLASVQIDGQPLLIAGGGFRNAGGTETLSVARWNGQNWAPMGAGFGTSGSPGFVSGLSMWDDGSGPSLYASGAITRSGNQRLGHVARWNGSAWRPLLADAPTSGLAPDNTSRAMAVFDDGNGPALYLAGELFHVGDKASRGIARWTGVDWEPVAGGPEGGIRALAVHDDGSGPKLYAGGTFSLVGGQQMAHLARWDGQSWSTVGAAPDGPVFALHSSGFGGNQSLYVGGGFQNIGSTAVNFAARWNGSTWQGLGSGFNFSVRAFATADLGAGERLYAAGTFSQAGGVSASHVAAWNGSAWSALGAGVNDGIETLAVFNDGQGVQLYAGGVFTQAGGQPASGLARWNGSSWSVPAGTPNPLDDVVALAAVGDSLWVAGRFIHDNQNVRRIVRYQGGAWVSPAGGIRLDLPSGVNDGPIFNAFGAFALHPFNRGGIEEVYVGGLFDLAGATPSQNLAAWRCTRDPEPVHSGLWFDPQRDGEGFVIEHLEDGTFFVIWYTYDIDGSQMWLVGQGAPKGDSVIVDMQRTRGARFGDAFDPADVVRESWGRLRFNFTGCDSAHVDFLEGGVYGRGSYGLTHLARLAGTGCGSTPAAGAAAKFSGHFFDPARDGEGFTVYMVNDDQQPVPVVVWFTYDPDGNQAWVMTIGELVGNRIVANESIQPSGARWGRQFDPADVDRRPWGAIEIEFDGCAQARVDWASILPEYGNGGYDMIRLTKPAGLSCP
jgi:trimeric autotransporter adhesin